MENAILIDVNNEFKLIELDYSSSSFLNDVKMIISDDCSYLGTTKSHFLHESFSINPYPFKGNGIIMLIDDNGKMKPHTQNILASFLHGDVNDYIAGRCIITGTYYNNLEESFDYCGLSEHHISLLTAVLSMAKSSIC